MVAGQRIPETEGTIFLLAIIGFSSICWRAQVAIYQEVDDEQSLHFIGGGSLA
jgi:hypothetical protein